MKSEIIQTPNISVMKRLTWHISGTMTDEVSLMVKKYKGKAQRDGH